MTNPVYHRYFTSFIVFCIIFISGSLSLSLANPQNHKNYFAKNGVINDTFIVKMTTEPRVGEKQIRCIADVISICDNGKWKISTGQILVVFPKKDSGISPKYGLIILIQKMPFPIIGSRNPGTFQADEYYETKGVYHQVNLSQNSFFVIDSAKGNYFIHKCIEARDMLLNKLRSFLPNDKKIYGIAEALLIGYQSDLDPELMQVYGRSGVVHIIAISGLHVGILFAVFWWLTGFIPNLNRKTWIRYLFVLVFLWTFTLISGASPSVLRSTVMFSFMLVAKAFESRSTASGTLFLSAFVLLVYDPFLFWNLGFQLSYLAVAGILFLQKPIQSIVQTKNKILKMTTEMLSVTLAAQLATLPATLYYFHQFPTYFLLTNLIAVPLSTLILFLEIGVVSFYSITPISVFLGKITAWLIESMNRITEIADTLPFSNIDFIPFDIQEVVLCFGLILSLLLVYVTKEKKYLFATITWFFLSSIFFFIGTRKRNNQSALIIPHQYSNHSLFFIKGRSALCLQGKMNHSDSIRFAATLKGIRTTYRLEKLYKKITDKNDNLFFKLNGKSFLVVRNEKLTWRKFRKKEVDFLVLSENPRVSIKQITAFVHPKQVIITASNSKWNIMRWEKEIDSLPLPCFSIANRGAFIQ